MEFHELLTRNETKAPIQINEFLFFMYPKSLKLKSVFFAMK